MIIKNVSLLNKDFKIEKNMFVATEGEYITHVGKEDPQISGDVIDATGKVLMPAFYNTHCHVPMTLLRGMGEGLPLDRWLNEVVFPFEKHFSAEAKYWGAMLGGIELIKSGCVSLSDMYSDLVSYARGLHGLGMKANISNSLLNFDSDASYFDDRSYTDTAELLEWVKDHPDGRIKVDASIHSEYTTKEKAQRECIEYCRDRGMIMQMHVSETRSEVEACKVRHAGKTPVQYFDELGVFDGPVVAAHCIWLEDDDIKIMAKPDIWVSHNPSSNLKIGSGIAPIADYRKRGMNISLGTDGAASNNNLNYMEELHIATLLCRGASLDANAIPAEEMLKIATINGAKAQGRNDCGTVEPGKKADFILIDTDRPHMQPGYDTVSNIVFSAQSSDICMTVCDGKILYRDGEIQFADEEMIKAKAVEFFKKTNGGY